MTMVIRMFGGRQTMIKAKMLIFIYLNNNYHIHDLDHSIQMVYYRTSLKDWMDLTIFAKDYAEPKAFHSDVHGRP